MVSVIILLSGLFILGLSSLLLGNFNKVYLFYALLTWLWLRLNEGIFNLLIKKKINKSLAFSVGWITPIMLICFMGIFHLDLPIIILSIIALIDFLFFIKLNQKIICELNWKNLSYIFVSAVIIISLTTINTGHLVWMSDLAYTGIIGTDFYRDAVIIHSWSEYSLISHGVHGLLFEPYHSLFAFFFDPFISESTDIFQVFVIFAIMITPTLVFYGCSKIIINISSQYISKNWIFFVFFFILTFSALNIIISSQSVLMATLLFIPIIPIIFNILNNPKNANIEIILMCLMVPIIIYARAFHGLFALGLLFYFLLIKRIQLKLIIASSIVFSVLFVLLFFGQTERATSIGMGHGYFELFLLSSPNSVGSYFVPIIILFLIFTIFKKKLFTYKIFNRTSKDTFLYFLIFISILTLALVFRSEVFSDAGYQILPIYWFLFFFILIPDFSRTFFKSKKQKKIFELLNKKSLMIFILFIVSVNFIQKNLSEIYHSSGTLKSTIKNIRVLNNEWNENGINQFLIDNINTDACKKETLSSVCKLRTRILSVTSLKKFKLELITTKLINQAESISTGLKGNTAVYISPSHKYWSYFELIGNYYKFKPSLFFMAVGKMPMIFGAHPKSMSTSYSMSTAHNNGGTLKTLNKIGNQEEICKMAQIVKIQNIIIFQKTNVPKILQCK